MRVTAPCSQPSNGERLLDLGQQGREGQGPGGSSPPSSVSCGQEGAVGVRLGQATGPQGNPALWGKERAASPGLMGLRKEGNQPHSSASAPCPAAISSPTPQAGCAVPRSRPTEDRTGVQGFFKVKQQLGASVWSPPLLTLINPKISKALGGPQITLGLQTGRQDYLVNRSLQPLCPCGHRWAF